MATNPIQRKTRNAFLLGMVIMLIIAAVVIALLYFTLFKDYMTDLTSTDVKTYVYRLTSSVESGEQIPINKIELVELYVNDLPLDYINDLSVTEYKSKVNLQAGTVLSSSLLYKEKEINNSTRLMEYNMLTLPSTLQVGDYVDIRLTMPSGQDCIVLSKKEVKGIQSSTISFYLTEDEILMMSSAIIESYIMNASNLYVNQYVEAGVQNAATPTYSVNSDVYQLIMSNSQKGVNIEDYAKINESYNTDLRNTIERELSKYSEGKMGNIEAGITQQKEKSMSLYLSGLSAETEEEY